MTIADATIDKPSFLKSWGPLAAVALTVFMTALDGVGLPVAATNITSDFNSPVSGIQAAFALFSLVAASTYLTGGKLGDRYGRKRIHRTGIVLYGLGMLLALLSPNLVVLIAGWSILRGIGMGLLLPSVFGLILANYAGTQRALAFGVLGALAPFGAVIGPLLMGWAATNLSWRVAFGLDLAIIKTIQLLSRSIVETNRRMDAKLDWVGTVLSALGIGLLILGPILASQPNSVSVGQASVITLAGVAVLALLLIRCQRVAAAGKEPLFHLSLYKYRQFTTGWTTLLLLFFLIGATILVIPIFLQTAAGFDALQSAYAMTPIFVAAALAGLASSWVIQRLANRRYMQAALVVTGLGYLWLRAAVGPSISTTQLLLPIFVVGLGLGLGLAQAPNIILSAVEPEEGGEASGLNATAQDVGIGLGSGIIGSLFLILGPSHQSGQVVMLSLLIVVAVDFVAASLIPPNSQS